MGAADPADASGGADAGGGAPADSDPNADAGGGAPTDSDAGAYSNAATGADGLADVEIPANTARRVMIIKIVPDFVADDPTLMFMIGYGDQMRAFPLGDQI